MPRLKSETITSPLSLRQRIEGSSADYPLVAFGLPLKADVVLQEFYLERNFELAWYDAQRRPSPQALALIDAIGKIGRDRMGELAEEDLASEGLRSWLVHSEQQLTSSVAVFVDDTGERSMVSGQGADHFLLPSELPRDVIEKAGHLHLTAWSFFTDPPRAFSTSVAALAAVVRALHEEGVPVVPRGAGTGLSGGALPVDGGVIVGTARMNRILEIDVPNRLARVQPGGINGRLTDAARPHGLYYAPDPSSQIACTIGGNVAENSGGVHCLKYGLTANNVLGIEMVLISGEVIRTFGASIPLFGVCLGHQCIGEVFGGEVVRADRLMHGKTSPVLHNGEYLFKGIESPFEATRYHSLIVKRETLPDCLEITAETDEGEIMGLRHRELPIWGVQFHPESILSEQGHELLANFLKQQGGTRS